MRRRIRLSPTLPPPAWSVRTVSCIICRSPATVKLILKKDNKPMLRCDNCGVLIFANKQYSQQILRSLQDITANSPVFWTG